MLFFLYAFFLYLIIIFSLGVGLGGDRLHRVTGFFFFFLGGGGVGGKGGGIFRLNESACYFPINSESLLKFILHIPPMV